MCQLAETGIGNWKREAECNHPNQNIAWESSQRSCDGHTEPRAAVQQFRFHDVPEQHLVMDPYRLDLHSMIV